MDGAPFVYGGVASVMDMATTRFCYGAPELHLQCSALADIAHYFQIPFWGASGCVESKVLDEQAAVELTMSILMAGLSGSNLVHDNGLMDQASLVCPEIVLLCDEIMDMVKKILQGVTVSPETLALDVIHKVGPGGNFLAEDHTYKHFRNFWTPTIFSRQDVDPADAPAFSERLNQKAREIIETHEVPPLPEDTVKELLELEKKWLT
jgi:trimethylamine---corrinoid protein Co-methyltransferase